MTDGHDWVKSIGKKLRFVQDDFVLDTLPAPILKRLGRLRASELETTLDAYDRADRLGRISRIRRAL